jgi:predicted TIM-barrel fold metal-dependent hydrolase
VTHLAGLGIVDAQVHANQIAPGWHNSDTRAAVEAAVAAMDAVGVRTLIHDEVTGVDADLRVLPGHEGPDGTWQAEHPFATEAVRAYPERFGFVGRVDKDAPDIAAQMACVAARPGCVGLRIAYVPDQTRPIADGAYDRYFRLAAEHRLPVFASVSTWPEVVGDALERFTDLVVILDHTGVDYRRLRTGAERSRGIDRVTALAEHPNLGVKWCHVERLDDDPYPFPTALTYLRQVVDAFGAERVMWASDSTEALNPARSNNPATWAQTIHYLLDTPQFTVGEKEWILGGTARAMLRWRHD